jgi:hypothetical protein
MFGKETLGLLEIHGDGFRESGGPWLKFVCATGEGEKSG